MGSGLVPINQQNALPLYTVISGAGGGRITVIGTSINRYWDSVAVGGITSAGNPGAWVTRGAQFNLESASFDWRGCSRFSLVCTITNNTALGLGAAAQWLVYLTHGTSAPVFPLVDNDKANILQPSAINILTSLAPGASVVRNATWAASEAVVPFGTLGAAGAFWKVVINTTAAALSIPLAGQSVDFSCELWGAT